MNESAPVLQVVRAAPERVEEALSALLAAGPAAAARFARQAEGARIALDRIWCLADAFGRYRLAVLAVPSLGRTAMLLASHPHSEGQADLLGGAIRAAADGCADCCDIAQALIEPDRRLDIAAFEAGGLTPLATLEYLERKLPRAGTLEGATAPAGWRIECLTAVSEPGTAEESSAETVPAQTVPSQTVPRDGMHGADPRVIRPDARNEIIAVLEASYRNTLDCPGLAGLRRTTDVLDGHFGLGTRARHWLLARRDARGARAEGVCLFNGSTDGTTGELVYLGLAPEARGKGIARALVLEGLHRCSRSRFLSVSLAVDSRNTPARRLYESLGFHRTSSRVALVRALASTR